MITGESTGQQERILVVDDNAIFRIALAERLRACGYEVATAETGERGFLILRNWERRVDWLYCRAELPGLIDGAIVADAYHDRHPNRPAVIAGTEPKTSPAGDLILNHPTPFEVLDAIRQVIEKGPEATLPIVLDRAAA